MTPEIRLESDGPGPARRAFFGARWAGVLEPRPAAVPLFDGPWRWESRHENAHVRRGEGPDLEAAVHALAAHYFGY